MKRGAPVHRYFCGDADRLLFVLEAHKVCPDVQVLHQFRERSDGKGPTGQLARDPAGNFYGTAYKGGTRGRGTVYKMAPNTDGTWTFSVLYNFVGGDNGAHPPAGAVLDAAGNLYGITWTGSSRGYATPGRSANPPLGRKVDFRKGKSKST